MKSMAYHRVISDHICMVSPFLLTMHLRKILDGLTKRMSKCLGLDGFGYATVEDAGWL